MNTDSFRYAADQRATISACSPRELNDGEWRQLETFAATYECRSSQKILKQRSASQIAKTARKLELQLKPLESAKVGPPELSVWLKALCDIDAWAKLQQLPKSQRNRSNRARSDVLDGYLTQLVQFYMTCGGHAGTAPSSLCARFVDAVASPALALTSVRLAPSAISNLIRSRVWFLAQKLSPESPEIGTPALTIR